MNNKYKNNQTQKILDQFYKQQQSTEINMITDPVIIASILGQSKFYQQNHKIIQNDVGNGPLKLIQNRVSVLKRIINNEKQKDLQRQNEYLNRQIKQKNEEIQKLRNLIELQNFNIEMRNEEVKNEQGQLMSERINKYFDELSKFESKMMLQIQVMNRKIERLKGYIQLQNIQHNRKQPNFQMPLSISPICSKQLLQMSEQEIENKQISFSKHSKVFIREQRQYYKIIDENGQFIQKGEVRNLMKKIEEYEDKLNLAIKNNVIKQGEIDYSNSFLKILKKLEVVKVDLVKLDHKANNLNQIINNNINIHNFTQFK